MPGLGDVSDDEFCNKLGQCMIQATNAQVHVNEGTPSLT